MAAAFAAGALDWWAVDTGAVRAEYVAKPLATILLLAAALALDPSSGAARAWFVVALLFCLGGDVFLMLPADRFVFGLASFLVGHLVFIGGFFVADGGDGIPLLVTAPLAIGAIAASAVPVLRGAAAEDPRLRAPVLTYMAVISFMLVASAVTGSWLAVGGAAAFVLSDSILARNRFVRPMRHGRLATMVTYHGALALLVISLV